MADGIFLQVLNMSYTASYVILAVLLARMLLNKAPKRFSYALWGVALFRLVCPWSFESGFSLLSVGGRTPQQLRPFPQQGPVLGTIPGQVSPMEIGMVSPPSAPASPLPPEPVLGSIFTLIWLVGMAALLGYSVVMLVRLKRRLRDAVHDTGNQYRSAHLSTPFVIGIIRPKIYLPQFLTETEKRYILLHEETHLRRLDHITKLVSFFVLCLHWFNPLVWLAFFLSGRDMEMSCDEAVIGRLGNEVKKEYSATLLSLSTGRRIVGGTPLAFGEGDAKTRIIHVLHYKKPAFWVMMAAVVGVVALWIGLGADPKAPAPSAPKTPEEYAQALWQHRTPYLGDNSAVGNLVSSLEFPQGATYDGIELHTGERPYMLTIHLKTDTETRNYYTGTLGEGPFQVNACLLFSLIENVEYITFDLDDGVNDPYALQYTTDWAENLLSADPWRSSESLEDFTALVAKVERKVQLVTDRASAAEPDRQDSLTFFVKPDEPPQVIGETAANLWLQSFIGEQVPPEERIESYQINQVTVISGGGRGQPGWQEMEYHYVARIDYDLTTATPEYLAPGDGVSGKGSFGGLYREIYIREETIGGAPTGQYEIVGAGTGGGEQVFLQTPVHPQTRWFYDYLNRHPVSMILEGEGEGFTDLQMATYALSELILQQMGSYRQEVGFPRAEMDAVVQKYFGTTVTSYENRMTTVLPTGNITSTGWGGNGILFILKELNTLPDGKERAQFYACSFGMDGPHPAEQEAMLQGFFEGYESNLFLVTLTFERLTDEAGETYLRFYDAARQAGPPQPPYRPYQG